MICGCDISMLRCLIVYTNQPQARILMRLLILIDQMQEGDNRTGVLKVFRTKRTNNKPGSHNLPIIFMVRFKKGANPQYTSYKIMREQFPQLLLDYFENRIVLRDAEGTRNVQYGQSQPLPAFSQNQLEIGKLSPIKESKLSKNSISRKIQPSSPKKQLFNKQVALSTGSRPLRTRRFKEQQAKQKEKELSQSQQQKESNQLSQSLQQQQKQVIQKDFLQNETQSENMLDYDHLIEQSACLNLICPAVISPIKQKSELVVQPRTRINFKETQRERQFDQESEDRGKDERGKQKLLREPQKNSKKKKVKKFKKKTKSKGKSKR